MPKVKLLQSLLHNGVEYKIGSVVEGIENSVCESIVARGLAENSDEDATHVLNAETGVTQTVNDVPTVAAEDALKSQHDVNNTPEAVAAATVLQEEENQAAQEAAPSTPKSGGLLQKAKDALSGTHNQAATVAPPDAGNQPTQEEIAKTLEETGAGN